MDEISRRRWQRSNKPRDLDPRLAIMAALDRYDADEEKPDHVIVIFGRHCDDGADGTRFFQAGNYSHHGQVGLIVEAGNMMRESGT